MAKPLCRTQLRTPEIDDEDDYVPSVLSENYIGELEKNRVLDRNIEKEKEARILLYTSRLESGKDLFTGECLELNDLITVRGLDSYNFEYAVSLLTPHEKARYPELRIKHELDHDT